MTKQKRSFWVPSLDDVREEMDRVKTQGRFNQALKSTIGTVLVVAALAVLVAAVFLPVLQMTGTSMQPNFMPGDILVARKTDQFSRGDICTFYYNNKLIIKRVIAFGGDTVDISEDGVVSINGKTLNEPYVKEKALGLCDQEFPFEVPLGQMFLLGDNRESSVDSRSADFGCISGEEVLGKVFLRVWPLNAFRFFG